jgi:hypothetical protein
MTCDWHIYHIEIELGIQVSDGAKTERDDASDNQKTAQQENRDPAWNTASEHQGGLRCRVSIGGHVVVHV